MFGEVFLKFDFMFGEVFLKFEVVYVKLILFIVYWFPYKTQITTK